MVKQASTNNLYQSTFMPIFQQAENKIKLIILTAFLYGMNLINLRYKLSIYIKEIIKKIPDISDKDTYIKGLYNKTEYLISNYYNKPMLTFNNLKRNVSNVSNNTIVIKTPNQLLTENNKLVKDIVKYDAKGYVRVQDYPKQVKKYINQLSQEVITTSDGKKPISLWQKAELDVRYQHQQEMLSDLNKAGVKLAWISSHPDCSKRCECFQGSLVSLDKHAQSPQTKVDKKFKYNKRSFIVDRVDGHNVYSLTDIMNVTDEYGYTNNIIVGFNCRHYLIPYKEGEKPVKDFSQEDIKKQRAIENNIRAKEREIRLLKSKVELYNKTDLKQANYYKKLVKLKIEQYKRYCEKNGYAWFDYRIK